MSTAKKVFLKPCMAGLKVHDGQGGTVPEEGKEYVLTTFLQRRINDGDLVTGRAPRAAKKEEK